MVDSVLTEMRDQVAIISLNRPDALNAWNGPMCQALDDALKWASDDDKVGAVVITGVGRAFCAGADLSGGGDTFVDGGSARSSDDDVNARTPKFLPWDVPKPVIAAINGHAVGVGATYALACDIRIIARTAKLAFVFARRGMLPELGSHAILPRVVGLSNASDLLLSGRAVQGEEATSLGLASACVDAELVLDLAVERAQEMAVSSAPVSMAISKRLLWESMGLADMRAVEEPLFDWVAQQSDSVEGVVSFLEKRPPKWGLSATSDFPHKFFK
ncbi:MAG: enoyl-CoA hydratase/carnithine racemase [Limisphaerales bacterium]|jgi:enoyl-CoA hydratase/carnithine racemase